ncbi:MAG TPA: hypothetical protein VMW53_00580 [archaeon]|nr:hypothetical protein [archaeon]
MTPNILKESVIKNVFRIARLYTKPDGKVGVPVSKKATAAVELIASSSQND